MAYTNSSLVTYKNLTADRTAPRNHKIDTITIHCYVGQVTAKEGCDYFAKTDRKVSSNYVVGYDGSIGLSVEEQNRAWTSGGKDKNGNPIRVNGISGSTNDHRAVTIEVACDTKHPYAVTEKAMKALIELVADICKRNDIKKLLWKGDKSLVGKVDQQNMTVHRWFSNTACPGDYLYNKHSYIADEVNKKLGATATKPKPTTTTTKPTPAKPTTTGGIAAGTTLTLKNISLYASSSAPKKSSSKTGTYYVWSKDVVNNRIRITNNKANVGKAGQVTGWISCDDARKSVGTTTGSVTTTTSKPVTKSLDDWANEVIAGKHGNGILKRTTSLKKAGCPYSYVKVQSRVNALLKKKK